MKAIKKFGQSVRLLRQQRGLTQEDLGDLIGKDRAYVSQLERGLKNATIATMVLVATALDVELSFGSYRLC